MLMFEGNTMSNPAHWVTTYDEEGWAIAACKLNGKEARSFNTAFYKTAVTCRGCLRVIEREDTQKVIKDALDAMRTYLGNGMEGLSDITQERFDNVKFIPKPDPVVHMLVSPWDDLACGASGAELKHTTNEEELTCLECWVGWFQYVNEDYQEQINRQRTEMADLQAEFEKLGRELATANSKLRARAIKIERRDNHLDELRRETVQMREALTLAENNQAQLEQALSLISETAANYKKPMPKPTPKLRRVVAYPQNINQYAPTTETSGPMVHRVDQYGVDALCGDFRLGDAITPFVRNMRNYDCYMCRFKARQL